MQHEFLQKNQIVDEIIEAKRTQLHNKFPLVTPFSFI